MPEDKAGRDPQREEAWRANEEARRRRLREDAQRPMAVNLAEGLAFSEWLSTYNGEAKTPDEQLKAFRTFQKKAANGD